MNRFNRTNSSSLADEQQQQNRAKPLREFNEAPPPKTPSAFRVKLQQITFWLIPILVLLAIIAGGIAVAIKLQFNGGARPDENTVSRSVEPTNDEAFLEAYLETYGGREALQSVHSIQTTGRLKDGETIWGIEITNKIPNSASILLKHENTPDYRYSIESDTVEYLSGQAGEREGPNTLLSQESESSMIPYARILDPLCEAALGGGTTILSRREYSNSGREMLQLELQRPDKTVVYCKLDRETHYLQSIEENIANGDARYIRRVEFDDYRMVSGVVLPFRLKVFHYDLLKTELMVDSIRIN